MKTFENFNIDKKEEFFLQLAHLDELDIRFDFIEYEEDIFYFYKGNWMFVQDKKNKYFYINYDKIFNIIKDKFNLNYDDIKDFMSSMVDKHFKLKGYTPSKSWIYSRYRVDKHFKLKY